MSFKNISYTYLILSDEIIEQSHIIELKKCLTDKNISFFFEWIDKNEIIIKCNNETLSTLLDISWIKEINNEKIKPVFFNTWSSSSSFEMTQIFQVCNGFINCRSKLAR